MKIAIDLSIVHGLRTGVGNYAYYLVRGLAAVDRSNQYTLFLNRANCQEFSVTSPNFETVIVPLPLRGLLWTEHFYFARARLDRFDVVHVVMGTGPILGGGRRVITVYDLALSLGLKTASARHRLYWMRLFPLWARRADRVIAISESTQADIERIYRVPSERIRVTHMAADIMYYPLPRSVLQEFRATHHLTADPILYVGTVNTEKNITRLLQTYRLLRDRHGIGNPLVLVGKPCLGYDKIVKAAQEMDLGDHVIFTGYVPDEELPFWYNLARVFVYPSLYEGFGLPVVEAMACGAPVVVSNKSSLPEVVGEAGVLFDPYDMEAMVAAILPVLSDNAINQQMRAKSLKQASRFSWEQTARQTIAVYEEMAGQKA